MQSNYEKFNQVAGAVHRMEAGDGMKGDVGPPDHMGVQGAINVIANDMRQLQEEIGELRSRLSPMLVDREQITRERQGIPVNSKMAAELGEILTMVQQCREWVQWTDLQLDL